MSAATSALMRENCFRSSPDAFVRVRMPEPNLSTMRRGFLRLDMSVCRRFYPREGQQYQSEKQSACRWGMEGQGRGRAGVGAGGIQRIRGWSRGVEHAFILRRPGPIAQRLEQGTH